MINWSIVFNNNGQKTEMQLVINIQALIRSGAIILSNKLLNFSLFKSSKLIEGKIGIKRYYLNNFEDYHKQDCYDLLLKKLDTNQKNYSYKPKFNTSVIIFF